VKPLLLKHYRIRLEPAEDDGEQTLVFTSEDNRLVIRGRSFPEFLERVVPLLDGRRTLDQVTEKASDLFERDDLEQTIVLLAEQGIVADAEQLAPRFVDAERLGPQLSYLHEVGPAPALVVDRLARARVTVVGLGAVGAVAATALAAANVGQVRCVDDSLVSAADPYLAQLFGLDDVGSQRAEVTSERIRAVNPAASVEVLADALLTDEDVADATGGSDFVLGCLDPGLASITDKVNRACLAQRTPWSLATVSAFEGIVGPTVIPYETACYRCYQARVIAAQNNPAEALADQRAREESTTDTSPYRENLAFGAGIVGHLLALQAYQFLTGLRPQSVGRILVIDFLSSSLSQHVVLRKPWCPACFAGDEA
jgi:molybdopterin-synthase adenylyltransferase